MYTGKQKNVATCTWYSIEGKVRRNLKEFWKILENVWKTWQKLKIKKKKKVYNNYFYKMASAC